MASTAARCFGCSELTLKTRLDQLLRCGERDSPDGVVRQRASANQGVWSKEKLRRLSTWNLDVYDARDSTVSVSVVDFLNLKRADTMP